MILSLQSLNLEIISQYTLLTWIACFCLIDVPDPGAYKVLSSFEMEHRAALPKTNYYSFGLSASREQMNRCYNPMENSPRGSESRHMPGPGEYKYRNMTIGGHEGKHFSFLKRTTNVQGKQL